MVRRLPKGESKFNADGQLKELAISPPVAVGEASRWLDTVRPRKRAFDWLGRVFIKKGWGAAVIPMSAYPPKSGHVRCNNGCPLWAKSGLMQRSKINRYSITSSARAISAGGTVRPSAFAVLRLMTNSNLVGNSTGRSPGLAPFKILCT
jgi:hypothetical protein